ncbi:MAG TPA: ATP-binding protein [Candidatus Limnocylindria bacterium]|nr:ATP-binding protein [Candidatus Limnocylindria bacterium]
MAPVDPRTIFDAVLDALVEPVLVTDDAGVITYANPIALRCFGVDKHIGRPIAEHLARLRIRTTDGQPLPPALHPIPRALAQGQAVIGAELSIASDDGESTYVVNTVPLRAAGRLAGTVSVFHDVTTAARLEREVADHATRLEAIVNLVSDGVFMIGLDGVLRFTNTMGREMLGLQPGGTFEARMGSLRLTDLEGRPLPAGDYPSSRALRGETVDGLEVMAVTAAGPARRMRTSAHPLRHSDSTIYAALITWKDVTEEVAARAELESARVTAETASRLKDEFIAALSHELRTPLQPILGWTEVLRRHGTLDDVTARALEAIHRNIRQQVRLVDDLLDLSRIVHGKFALRLESFDLRDQVRASVESFEEGAAFKRIRLTATLPAAPMPMWGDGARVQQITTNLIANALKFTPGGGRVSVALSADGERARLDIEDTGEGILPEDLPVIFEAFRQGSQSSRRGGLGIGLDLVKRLTEMHGGTVEAFSEGSGRGAHFRITLPLAPPKSAPAGAHPAHRGQLGRRSVLVIEDNADTRDVLKFMLEVEGAHVDTAERGEEGVRAATTLHPDVILCDIGLPDIDGMEVARRIRAAAGGASVRLIALTGYGQAEDVRQAMAAGFEAHLTKPINLDQLMALLMVERGASG